MQAVECMAYETAHVAFSVGDPIPRCLSGTFFYSKLYHHTHAIDRQKHR
jgi:hypothetical protein